MTDKAIAVIQEAYVQGISTRSVNDLVKAQAMYGISKLPFYQTYIVLYESHKTG